MRGGWLGGWVGERLPSGWGRLPSGVCVCVAGAKLDDGRVWCVVGGARPPSTPARARCAPARRLVDYNAALATICFMLFLGREARAAGVGWVEPPPLFDPSHPAARVGQPRLGQLAGGS